MKTISNRLLHVALAFVLVLGLSAGVSPAAMAVGSSEETTGAASVETSPNAGARASLLRSIPATGVCEIGTTGYATLQDALDAVPSNTPTTITLLQDISVTDGLSITNKNITFDLGGFNLAISNATATDTVTDGLDLLDSTIDYVNAGTFTVSAVDTSALYIEGGSCELTGATAQASGTEDDATFANAIMADSGAKVVVNGDVTATGVSADGIDIMGGSQITVNGNVSAQSGEGVFATDDGTQATVNGTISAGDGGDAVSTDANAVVTVNGNLVATGDMTYGIIAFGGSQVAVTGAISAENGEGIYASDSGTQVTVTGNISAQGNYVVDSESGAKVTVTGNVLATDLTGSAADEWGSWPVGVYAASGTVTINGNVISSDTGVYASTDYSGRRAPGSQVTINGTITAPLTYILLEDRNGNDTELTAADYTTPTTNPGYLTYTDGVSTVWVQNINGGGSGTGGGSTGSKTTPAKLTTPTSSSSSKLAKTGDESNLNTAMAAGAVALIALGAALVVMRRRAA